MKCPKCGSEVRQSEKYCGNCGANLIRSSQGEDKFNFFDITASNPLTHASLIIALLTASLFELYIYIDSTAAIYAMLFAVIFLTLSAYKSFSSKSVWISLAGVVTVYLFGGVFALPLLVWLITTGPSQRITKLSVIKRSLIVSWAKNGIIWTTIGAVVTVGSMLIADEGGTYYILYGASLVGAYYLMRGAFHSVYPKSLDQDEKKIIFDMTNPTKEAE